MSRVVLPPHVFHITLTLLLGWALAAAGPSAVTAGTPSVDRVIAGVAASSAPAAAFASLPPQQQRLILDRVSVASLVTEAGRPTAVAPPASQGVTAAAGGCWTVTWGRSAYNIYGAEIWSLKQRIDWCGNGSTITSVQRTRWIETYVPGWSGSIIQDPTWGGVGSWSFRAFVQADMVLTIVYPWGHWYPWLDMTVTAAGGLTGSGGGT